MYQLVNLFKLIKFNYLVTFICYIKYDALVKLAID